MWLALHHVSFIHRHVRLHGMTGVTVWLTFLKLDLLYVHVGVQHGGVLQQHKQLPTSISIGIDDFWRPSRQKRWMKTLYSIRKRKGAGSVHSDGTVSANKYSGNAYEQGMPWPPIVTNI